MVELYPR